MRIFNIDDSSTVSAFWYNPDDGELIIWYTNGYVYSYKQVEAETVARMAFAPSVGKFVHSRIRGVYSYEKL